MSTRAAPSRRPARQQRSGVGARGEARTREVLARVTADPSSVALHGLSAPGMARGDLDHVLVRQTADGPVVIVIDSKCWAPGVYWSVAGRRTYRGLHRFRPAKHVTVGLAAEKLREHLGVPVRALVVIWPSHPGRITSIGLRLGDATPWCRGERLATTLARLLPPPSGDRPEAAVAALRALQRPRSTIYMGKPGR